MIGARGRGIVAVIGRDDQQVRLPQQRQHVAKAFVEPLQVPGIPFDIVAMPKAVKLRRAA